MIPKTIHYIWLGKNKKPENFPEVLKSWNNFAEGFEIKEWNEGNFSEFDLPPYFFYLLKNKKWAFASDVLRFFILDKYGGVYLDVDQVLIKDINLLWEKYLQNKSFFISKYHQSDTYFGFGFIGQKKNFIFSKKMIDYYNSYKKEDYNKSVIVNKVGSEIIVSLSNTNEFKDEMKIFSQDYFYPLAGLCEYTENSFSYHKSNVSWQPKWKKFLYRFKIYFWLKEKLKKFLPKQIEY
jgi:mannosyltransferase OCH1-like enzyme